jgi:hypothetical protein
LNPKDYPKSERGNNNTAMEAPVNAYQSIDLASNKSHDLDFDKFIQNRENKAKSMHKSKTQMPDGID